MMYLENIFNGKLLAEYQGTITRSFHMYSTWYIHLNYQIQEKKEGGVTELCLAS